MKIRPAVVAVHACLLAAFLSPAALAAEPGFYGGFNVGGVFSQVDKTRISNALLTPGFTYTGRSYDNDDIGFKIFGGYQFTPYFSVEAGYFDIGTYNKFNTSVLPAGVLKGDMAFRGINVDAVVTFPITDKVSVFGRAGVHRTELDSDFKGTGYAAGPYTTVNGKRRDTNEKFGVGMAYELNDAVSLRLEAERYNVDDTIGRDGNINMYSLGVVYRLGTSKPAPVAVAPTPAPAPRAAAPAPAPTPAPQPVVTTLSADSFFAFDKDQLLPAGMRELDTLATSLRGTEYDVINVTGHTDRLGAAGYNLDLSRRRAESVKAYLITKGIMANKITARGINGSQPVTTASMCPGTVATPQLIACLQPDRRVDVEVTARR